MPYEKMPWDKQILAFDSAIARVDEAILRLQSQSFAVNSRMMLRRAQMVKFLSKAGQHESKQTAEIAAFRSSIDVNGGLTRALQARIAGLSNRLAALRTHRAVAMRKQSDGNKPVK